jgi:transcriptional regulator with XRE-family HTH domain
METRQERDRRREALQQEFGQTVRDLYEARHLTQRELAEKIGQPRQFLTRLESGRDVKVTLDVIEDLADALEVQAGELLEPFLRRSLMKGTQVFVVPKSDPSSPRRRAASFRLTAAAAHIPVAAVELLADLVEARAGVRVRVPIEV